MTYILHFLARAVRLWNTVRYLRPIQIAGRIRNHLYRPRPNFASAPGLSVQLNSWVMPARRSPSLLGLDKFRFLNEECELSVHGWDDPLQTKLWRYNLHYFDDLTAKGAEDRLAWHYILITRWIDENPPGLGSGWEPYPVSIRIVNWIKWALAGNELSDQALHSLAIQARWLVNRLEWHLLGNHLFVNAKALVCAGLFFEGEEAHGWLKTGLDLLRKELPEQVLDDGGQFELSPMYHALALEDLLDLCNFASTFAREDLLKYFSSPVPSMLHWLEALSHPDGRISFFNDAAFGVAPENEEIIRYAQDLGFSFQSPAQGITALEASGYVRLAQGDSVLIADVSRIGPDYLPGHAHADTLSFEFSLEGKRLFVNSGTSVYGTGADRQRQRGTPAHSTVVIDGKNSSEVWSGFRVGRRASPFDVAALHAGSYLIVRGAHDGYAHLPGRPIHRREWRLAEDKLFVTDRIFGTGFHRLEAYFHLGPDIVAIPGTASGTVELRDGNGAFLASIFAEGGETELIASSWHPEFGLSVETSSIRVSAEQSLPHELRIELVWSAL